LRYRWPLNVRELERCVGAALVLANGLPIDVRHLPDGIARPAAAAPAIPGLRARRLSETDAQMRERLSSLLRENGGNVAAVARSLGKARMQVHRWVKRFDLSLADYR
jgi:transcriptional regulator of acetoin/glycerol metabolism